MMSESVKYTFDTEFDRMGRTIKERPPRPKTRFTAQDVETARAEGFAEGQAGAQAQASQAMTAAVNASLEAILGQLGQIIGTLQSEVDRVRAEGARLALETTRYLAGTLVDQHGHEHVQTVVEEALASLRNTPEVTVRLSPDMVTALGTQLETAAQNAGYAGTVHIVEDGGLTGVDCILNWADGGAFSDWDAGLDALKDLIRNHLEAEGNTQLDLFDL